MNNFLTLVFEYAGENLFNAYIEEVPLIRVDAQPIEEARAMINAMVHAQPDSQLGKIREIKLIFPERFQQKD